MQMEIRGALLELVEGDITKQDTEAIVNAANPSLLGGGGRENRYSGGASPRVCPGVPPSLALASLIRRRLIALTLHGRRPVALDGRDGAVAPVSLGAKRRHRGQSKH